MIRSLLCMGLLVAVTQPVTAQRLLAIDGFSGDLYSVDCRSGSYSLLNGSSSFLTLWTGLARDSFGHVYSIGVPANQLTHSDLYQVDPGTGQMVLLTQVDQVGISSLAFGPGDVLYATVDIDYPSIPHRYELFSIDLSTGISTRIGPIGVAGIVSMDFDGTTMYLWGAEQGLHTIDLATGQASDVNPGFLGSFDLSKSMCFSDNGTLYALDFALWTVEPSTGVGSFVDYSFPGIWGGVEFIPGTNQTLSLWQTEQVGNPSNLELRGATPNGQLALFAASNQDGSVLIPSGFPCAGTVINLNPSTVRLLTLTTADSAGNVSLGPIALPPQALGRLRIQALDLQTCVTSNRIETVF